MSSQWTNPNSTEGENKFWLQFFCEEFLPLFVQTYVFDSDGYVIITRLIHWISKKQKNKKTFGQQESEQGTSFSRLWRVIFAFLEYNITYWNKNIQINLHQ